MTLTKFLGSLFECLPPCVDRSSTKCEMDTLEERMIELTDELTMELLGCLLRRMTHFCSLNWVDAGFEFCRAIDSRGSILRVYMGNYSTLFEYIYHLDLNFRIRLVEIKEDLHNDCLILTITFS